MSETKKSLLKKPFSWGFIVLFSLVVGIVVGVLDCIPALRDTSFTDPALTFDVWIPLAIFVVLGGKNTLDAALKCFVFFLVSQPVIYLVEIACDYVVGGGVLSELFHRYFVTYYIGAGWLWWTLLTLPGGAIAYQVKRDNVPAAVILAVATGGLAGLGMSYVFDILPSSFPRHLLSTVFCFVMAFALCFMVLKKKNTRILAVAITAVAAITTAALFFFFSGKPVDSMTTYDVGPKTAVSCEIKDKAIAEAELDSDNALVIHTSEAIGNTVITVTYDDGTTADFLVTVDSHALTIEEMQ